MFRKQQLNQELHRERDQLDSAGELSKLEKMQTPYRSMESGADGEEVG